MKNPVAVSLLMLFLLFSVFMIASCGDDDDDNDNGTPVDDDDDDNDDNDDDDNDNDDDDNDDDDNNDDDDDDTYPDDFLAEWPQFSIETPDYDETSTAGLLRSKAVEFDQWNEDHHQPFYGSQVQETFFADTTYEEETGYGGWADSTIWTGTYLGSQCFRYHVTGDPVAKENALRALSALSGHLHVTGRPGFIARYRAPQEPLIYPGDQWCDDPENDRCHHIEQGEFAGDFWWGETSRDQYTGWFFGMALAYDLLDDEDARDLIRADVTEVMEELLANHWWIIDEAGRPTDAAPNVMGTMRLSWLMTGYHITGSELLKTELQEFLLDSKRISLRLSNIAFMNRYAQYYGNNLAHTNWYNLLRLGKGYFSPDDYAFMLNLFETQVHTFTRLSHNPWFNSVFMSQGDYAPVEDCPYQAQMVEDLNDFSPVPHVEYYLPERTGYTLDPFSVFVHDLQVQFPFLEEIFGGVDYQAEEAFPVPEQCSKPFMFQKNPFEVWECGIDRPTEVNFGTDFLIAYWLASYSKFLEKND